MENYVCKILEYQSTQYDIWNEKTDEQILKLDWNESINPPTELVKKRILELAEKADFYQFYPNVKNEQLYSKIAEYLNIDQDRIEIFPSSDVLQEYVVRCWLRQGDNVLIQWPTYDNFRASAAMSGATINYYVMTEMKVDIFALKQEIRLKHPKLVYICNPNNPTGCQISYGEIKMLLEENPETMFLIDEAYIEFSSGSVANLGYDFKNIIISRTFSKAFAIANFRIGYMISHPDNIEIISKIRNSKNIPTFSQEAAIAVLEDVAYMERYVKEVVEARDFFVNQLKNFPKITVYDSNANFVLLNLGNRNRKQKLLEYLKRENIYIRDLKQDILKETFVRITIGTISQMKRVMEEIERFEVMYENCDI